MKVTLFTSHAGGAHTPNCSRVVFRCVLWLNDTSYTYSTIVFEDMNRKFPARNTTVTVYTDPERHNADGQTHRRTDDFVTVRSAKNRQ